MVTNRQPSGQTFNDEPQPAGDLSWCVPTADGYSASSDPTAFFDALQTAGKLAVFIHGLDSDWDDACTFTTTVADNLRGSSRGFGQSYAGVVIGFSWPSTKDITGYFEDRSNIRASAQSFANFISTLQSQLPAGTEISIIAHSEGCYMMKVGADALVAATPAGTDTDVAFEQVLLVAADLPEDCFASNGYAASIALVSSSVSVYFSNLDHTLLEADLVMGLVDQLGETVNEELFPEDYPSWYPVYRRLGSFGVPSLLETASSNVLEINCTGVDNGIGTPSGYSTHTAYFGLPQIVADIGAVLSDADPTTIANRVTLPLTDDREFVMWPASSASAPVSGGSIADALQRGLPGPLTKLLGRKSD